MSTAFKLTDAANNLDNITRLNADGWSCIDRAVQLLRKAAQTVTDLEQRIAHAEHAAEAATRRLDDAATRTRADTLESIVLGKGRPRIDPHGYHVYLLWGDDKSRPLYVGQSTNVLARLGTHMNSEKRHLVRSVQVLRLHSKADMDKRERELIRHYAPPLNTTHMPHRETAA